MRRPLDGVTRDRKVRWKQRRIDDAPQADHWIQNRLDDAAFSRRTRSKRRCVDIDAPADKGVTRRSGRRPKRKRAVNAAPPPVGSAARGPQPIGSNGLNNGGARSRGRGGPSHVRPMSGDAPAAAVASRGRSKGLAGRVLTPPSHSRRLRCDGAAHGVSDIRTGVPKLERGTPDQNRLRLRDVSLPPQPPNGYKQGAENGILLFPNLFGLGVYAFHFGGYVRCPLS